VDLLGVFKQLTEVFALRGGARTHCQSILESLGPALSALYGFICIEHPEVDRFDVISATGLDPATFRRLEARAATSALVRVLDVREPIDLLVNDEPTLDFLSRPTIVAEIVLVPVTVGSSCVGFVALAFDKLMRRNKADAVKLMQAAASLVAQTLRMERLASDESSRLEQENVHLKQELKDKYDFSNLIGNSSPMRQVYDQVTQIARSNATVLLRGESGTGKELIANAIHYNSLRSKRPFVSINCSALPEGLIESELFGYEAGTMPDSPGIRRGRFELAEGGTLFLDEIGALSMQTQGKLLRVLRERELERVGGTHTIKANVRLVTATNENLERGVADGTFREDVFYRLNAFTIFLPPLRERKSDILLLADHFLEKYASEHGKRIRRISTPAIDMLTAYHFPGNVRELENVIERAVLVCDTNVIHGHHLPPTLQTAEVSGTETRLNLATAVHAFERDMIIDALKSTRGNIAKAAKMLDSTERILGYKIKKYGVEPSRFRSWSLNQSS
jgi:Nif-specific regulatory protein